MVMCTFFRVSITSCTLARGHFASCRRRSIPKPSMRKIATRFWQCWPPGETLMQPQLLYMIPRDLVLNNCQKKRSRFGSKWVDSEGVVFACVRAVSIHDLGHWVAGNWTDYKGGSSTWLGQPWDVVIFWNVSDKKVVHPWYITSGWWLGQTSLACRIENRYQE